MAMFSPIEMGVLYQGHAGCDNNEEANSQQREDSKNRSSDRQQVHYHRRVLCGVDSFSCLVVHYEEHNPQKDSDNHEDVRREMGLSR